MIEDSTLVQVFATVLAGVLIFLTLERRFEGGKEAVDEAKNITKKMSDHIRKITFLEADRERLIQERSDKPDIISQEYYEHRMSNISNELDESKTQLSALQSEYAKMTKEYGQWIEQYMDVTTDEGITTMVMILFLVVSIISLLVGSIFDLPHLPDVITPLARIVSVVLFSIATILLVRRVYLHGKNVYRNSS